MNGIIRICERTCRNVVDVLRPVSLVSVTLAATLGCSLVAAQTQPPAAQTNAPTAKEDDSANQVAPTAPAQSVDDPIAKLEEQIEELQNKLSTAILEGGVRDDVKKLLDASRDNVTKVRNCSRPLTISRRRRMISPPKRFVFRHPLCLLIPVVTSG